MRLSCQPFLAKPRFINLTLLWGGRFCLAFVLNFLFFSNEGTTRDDTSRFDPFISHLAKYIEVVKSLQGLVPNPLRSKVIGILLDFRPIHGYIPQKTNYGVSI